MLYKIIRPLLFSFDAELAHRLAIYFLKLGNTPRNSQFRDPSLHTMVCDLAFPNPVGLAAGFDKQAEIMGAAFNLGFGAVELGTVTPQPQVGNPKPRLFRVPEVEGLINRFGFNSDGMDRCRERIKRYRSNSPSLPGILGINVGKNKETTDSVSDYVFGIETFAPYADYITINISSPNTPGLRDLQRRESLLALMEAVAGARNKCATKPPLFVKIAPDLTDEQKSDIADIVLTTGIEGIIIGNTTVTRPDHIPPRLAREAGGLSGKPLHALSTQMIRDFYKLTRGKVAIIGCGGIFSAEDAYSKIRAGASLVQIYTAMVYEGPGLINRINRELAALLKRDGFVSVAEAVGKD